MAQSCRYIDNCPLFQQFEHAHGKVVWMIVYCKGDSQAECERLKARERGETPSTTRLPDGSDLVEATMR